MDNEEYKGYTIRIEQDNDPEDPRQWDNLGVMYCKHRNYNLGDKQLGDEFNEYMDAGEIEAELKKQGAVIMAPLFLYEHSGITIKIGSFTGLMDPAYVYFDSGQVGWIVAFADDIKKEYNVKRISKQLKAKVMKLLEAEVKTYDQYLTGDIYGYIVEKDGDHQDSCWGFYGYEEALKEGKAQADYLFEEARKTKEAKTKSLIRSQVPLIYR